MWKKIVAFLLVAHLCADELTVDPPHVWDADCAACAPYIFPCEELASEVVLHLRNPLYVDGVLTTDEGGLLIAPDLRIQAEQIVYTRQEEIHTVECVGNLLVDYHGHTLVGERFVYDFGACTGMLTCGRTAIPPWYVGGETVLLGPQGDLVILNGYVTTSEAGEREVDITSPRILLTRDRILNVSNIQFRVGHVPLFWLPQVKIDMQGRSRLPFAVNFGWHGYLGTHAGIRYQFLSWNELEGYARLDGYLGRGLGGGIETSYTPAGRDTAWFSRNYYAHDLSIFDPDKRDRYRYQGTYFDRFFSGRTTVDVIYDFVSDGQFAADYQADDFALNTAGRTQATLRHQEPSWLASLFTRVRVNDFQSVNQELPTLYYQWHPFEIGSTGIIAENTFTASYLDFVFGDQVIPGRSFNAGRFETYPKLYRPFHLGSATVTPEASFVGIAYSDSQTGGAVGQAVGDFAVKGETVLSNCFGWWKHVIEPYVHAHFITEPRVPVNDILIFTLDDAYARQSYLRFGTRNALFTQVPCGLNRPLWIDLWANAYFATPTIPQTIPKGYINLEWMPTPRLLASSRGAWNFEQGQLDFVNARLEWTLSTNVAFGVEYRHRGPFDWRKADFYNFTLEAVRPIPALLRSPLSDRRDTLLARLFIRPDPDWTFLAEVRHGWNRTNQPTYFEYELQATRILFQHWQLLFNYEKRESDNRYSFALKLKK